MQARSFHLLAIALGTALLSPLALAQDQSTATTAQSSTSGQMAAPPTSSTATTAASGVKAKNFSKLDTNADGRISAAEANADTKLSGGFASLDADHDGYLSQSEYTTGAATMGSDNTGATMGNADWSDDSSKNADSDSTTKDDTDTDTQDDAKPTTP